MKSSKISWFLFSFEQWLVFRIMHCTCAIRINLDYNSFWEISKSNRIQCHNCSEDMHSQHKLILRGHFSKDPKEKLERFMCKLNLLLLVTIQTSKLVLKYVIEKQSVDASQFIRHLVNSLFCTLVCLSFYVKCPLCLCSCVCFFKYIIITRTILSLKNHKEMWRVIQMVEFFDSKESWEILSL